MKEDWSALPAVNPSPLGLNVKFWVALVVITAKRENS
jgi:hypothetical protein